MRELSELLSLGLSAASIDGLDEALKGTWHGSTYEGGKHIDGPWITLAHQGAPDLHVELAQDECGGAILQIHCAAMDVARIKAALLKYNPCIESVVYKDNPE